MLAVHDPRQTDVLLSVTSRGIEVGVTDLSNGWRAEVDTDADRAAEPSILWRGVNDLRQSDGLR